MTSSESSAGRFRVYLGMAFGVGKTYAMLQEATRRAARGTDVVVGFVETHGRPATAARLHGLAVVPPKPVVHRGALFAELDLDAILARRPELVLVDEIAHTNVPGSGRHEKRWQDVLELLDAGISVMSTLNSQHIESLAGTVEEITGTRVRERVPDAVLARADHIELVDSSPEELRRRMLRGDIYPADRIHLALTGFFRTENLTVLRELTERFLAGEADEDLLARLRRSPPGRAGGRAERVLVAVSDAPGTETLLRRAGRLAARLAADLYVVHVHPGEAHRNRRSARRAERLREIRQLADDLGGDWIEIEDGDPARAIMQAAAEHHATRIVLGSSRRSRWQHLLAGGSTVHRLTRLAGRAGVDVHITARPHDLGGTPCHLR
ncbi:two-component system, OmpR family, sensor histidine kinase KdpD [Actinacidiphila yanglinensis]|uniref:Two-component system, OmpR family, sensor histidine kinase KdpD n=1 Tax=Actinacidiphila yanglinensis TaxID=310779 RepID=A0A1H6D661_9ACTN|nr:universal stress protein [Actinacidiphila yanglinensis]SEG80761.1 two-component system, OmpR family, sensor histidine kinase KdpD [Actinacidiphila yanglinensis]